MWVRSWGRGWARRNEKFAKSYNEDERQMNENQSASS